MASQRRSEKIRRLLDGVVRVVVCLRKVQKAIETPESPSAGLDALRGQAHRLATEAEPPRRIRRGASAFAVPDAWSIQAMPRPQLAKFPRGGPSGGSIRPAGVEWIGSTGSRKRGRFDRGRSRELVEKVRERTQFAGGGMTCKIHDDLMLRQVASLRAWRGRTRFADRGSSAGSFADLRKSGFPARGRRATMPRTVWGESAHEAREAWEKDMEGHA